MVPVGVLHVGCCVTLTLTGGGNGFTVAVTVKLDPVQVPVFGVTVYVAVCETVVVLVNVPFTDSSD